MLRIIQTNTITFILLSGTDYATTLSEPYTKITTHSCGSGTSNGLDRYDGYELKHYSTAPRQPYLFIESNYINDIDEDDNNYLWVASEAGIMSIDLLHENLNFYKEYSGKNNNVLYSPVQALLVDDFNNLWVGKSDGLAYIILDEERQIKDIRILKKDVDIKTIVKTR